MKYDNNYQQSPDDALEDTKDENYQPVGNNPLPEDNDSPASNTQDPGKAWMPVDHPITDVRNDDHEEYEEGSLKQSSSDDTVAENEEEV